MRRATLFEFLENVRHNAFRLLGKSNEEVERRDALVPEFPGKPEGALNRFLRLGGVLREVHYHS